MIIFGCCLVAITLIAGICSLRREIINTSKGCNSYGKMLANKLYEIHWAIEKFGDNKFIEFSNKGKTFNISITDDEITSSCFYYHSIPVYTCKNIFINDELVCKLHKLDSVCSSKYYSAEFSKNRHDDEIAELIDVAYKTAKKLEKNYWASRAANNDKSFYKKEG